MAFRLRIAKMLGKFSVQLVSKISNLRDPDPPTLQTDGRSDEQADDMQSQQRALHVHRAVKMSNKLTHLILFQC